MKYLTLGNVASEYPYFYKALIELAGDNAGCGGTVNNAYRVGPVLVNLISAADATLADLNGKPATAYVTPNAIIYALDVTYSEVATLTALDAVLSGDPVILAALAKAVPGTVLVSALLNAFFDATGWYGNY